VTATKTRRPAARRPVPGRKGRAPYRWVIFGPAVVSGPAGWAELGQPLHAAGGLALTGLGLLLVPVLMLGLVTAPGTLLHALVPKDWRRRWRKHKDHPGPPGAVLRRTIMAADRGRCAACGITAAQVRAKAVAKQRITGARSLSQASLQFDHFFPWSLGGLLNFWNFFLLCPSCNIIKSNYWKYRESGNVVYRAFRDSDDIVRAAAILACEKRARWSLLRCWRAAWAL
jgi:5-methylcytosine-specific restriction endonuclease McrA